MESFYLKYIPYVSKTSDDKFEIIEYYDFPWLLDFEILRMCEQSVYSFSLY